MESKVIWVRNSIWDWYPEMQSYGFTSVEDRIRAYKLWEHAEALLTEESSEFSRVDVVSNLKRCLNQRLKFIEYVYSLKKVALKDSPKGYLEYLESLGLVRPYMLKQLMLIRNDIEHNDAPPPSTDRCKELLDLTWYFLKSTDSFVSWCKHDFILKDLTENGEETQYWLSIDIDYELDHQIKVNGWVPESSVSMEEESGFTLVEVKDCGSKGERWSGTDNHKDKLDSDCWLNGTLKPTEDVRLSLIMASLHASM
ncbi:TPA: hypothetical protein NJ348_004542 [Vibrio parahaemolyticus]|nr:hypothetical protein [Vibrio parahaemolyticus]TBT28614.1 hypothetical protein D5E85_24955 [Vibrio parahaemolyticus]HCG7147345.1 hypothetical protein [Vibrio parahaemolyticus]